MFKKLLHLILLTSCAVFMLTSAYAAPSVEGIQVYQKNLHLSPEHKQKLAEDINRFHNADSIWDVLRDEFSLAHYEDNPAVQEKIEWYMNNQEFLVRSTTRAAPYLYYILQQVKKRHLPVELVLLPIIESGYNPYSLSNMGAAGIWQLMPGTASGLGVKRNSWYDGRRDVITSTGAALNHLMYLQTFFEGNWLYAIAAYNTGEGNLLKAIRRNLNDGNATDFWSLPVAQQTKDYVPSLLALAIIISHPDQYPIYFPPAPNAPYLAQVAIDKSINLKYAANLAGLSYTKLMQLNSGFKKTSASTKGAYKLVLPIENVAQFSENYARSPLNSTISWTHYKVKTGDTLAGISKKFMTTTTALNKMNHLSNGKIRPGMNLLIPGNKLLKDMDDEDETSDVLAMNEKIPAEKSSFIKMAFKKPPSTAPYTLQPGDTVYLVRPQDTLASIAKRFHLDSQLIATVNRLESASVPAGTQLFIPTQENAQRYASANASDSKIQPGDTLYMIRRGDTIENVAAKFHTSPAAIRLANLMDDNSLREGEKLVVPTHMQG